MTTESVRGAPSLLDYLAVLRRRKRLFVYMLVLVPVVAVTLSLQQKPVYQASAEVLLVNPTSTTAIGGQAPYVDPNRVAQTKSELARVPAVAERVLNSVPGHALTVEKFLKNSSVATAAGSDLLTFSVKSSDPRMATALATAYAQAFADYERDVNTSNLESRRAKAEQAILQLEASGATRSSRYRALVRQEGDLSAELALQTPTAEVVREADRAVKVAPRTFRDGAIAVVLGLLLALIFAFLRDALDTRVRSVDVLTEKWGLPLLGELAPPPKEVESDGRLVMLAKPTSHYAEGFRVLRASLDFANSDSHSRTIMVTSAVGGEGKSTTAANLAVALARAGRRIVLIDGDLRSPSLHGLFALAERPGLVDVELGDADLAEALRQIDITDGADGGTAFGRQSGTLEVLPAGIALHDPDQLGAVAAIARIAQTVGQRSDVVLIDAAPLLPVGDSIALSAHVDALLLVARPKMLNMSAVESTRRILEASPAAKLGLILIGSEAADTYSQYRRYEGEARRRDGEMPTRFVSGSAVEVTENGGRSQSSETHAPDVRSGGADRAPS
jgi:succinoglycan biosynthesis transport protein ExoP